MNLKLCVFLLLPSIAFSSGYNSAVYLLDASSGKWSITEDTTGHLTTVSVSSIPTNALAPNAFVTQDSSFNLWRITIDTTGHLKVAAGGTTAQSITDILLNDSNKITWVTTVDTVGHLVTQ